MGGTFGPSRPGARWRLWASGAFATIALASTPLVAGAYPFSPVVAPRPSITYARPAFGSRQAFPNACAWHLASSPNKTTSGGSYQNQLNAVVANSATDAWAGGFYVSPTVSHALLQHFDGTKWTNVTAPKTGGSNEQILAMTSTSSSDVWAVGYFFDPTANQYETLVYHFNGTAWSKVASPNTGIFSALRAVSADSPTDAWAVGQFQDTSFNTLPLIEHWNGSSWSIVNGYTLNEPYSTIIGVLALSSTNIETLGDFSVDQNGDFLDPQGAVYNNGSWTLANTPPMGSDSTSDNVLAAVTPTNMWAIGDWFDGANFQTYAQHWNGSAWTTVTTPDPGGPPGSGLDTALFGGAAVSNKDVFGVGTYWDGQEWQTYTMQWNGSAWATVPSVDSGGADAVYNMLFGAGRIPGTNQVWAVGEHGTLFNSSFPTRTLILKFHC